MISVIPIAVGYSGELLIPESKVGGRAFKMGTEKLEGYLRNCNNPLHISLQVLEIGWDKHHPPAPFSQPVQGE